MNFSELIAEAKAEWGKVQPLLDNFLAANPGIEASAVTDAKAVVANVTEKLETAATTAVDAEVAKVAPAEVDLLKPYVDEFIATSGTAFDDFLDAKLASVQATEAAILAAKAKRATPVGG